LIFFLEQANPDRVHAVRPSDPGPDNAVPLVTTQAMAPRRSQQINGGNQKVDGKRYDQIERATSPVDERILKEFYADRPKDMHKYQLEGRQYVVYEGKTYSDLDTHRNGKFKRIIS